jgi:hypothetical protein
MSLFEGLHLFIVFRRQTYSVDGKKPKELVRQTGWLRDAVVGRTEKQGPR